MKNSIAIEHRPWRCIAFAAFVFTLTFTGAFAQTAPIPHHFEPFVLDSGVVANETDAELVVPVGAVTSAGAPWVRAHIGEYQLGPGSYITLTSGLDGATQRLDAISLPVWQYRSAFFNGDTVLIDLHVAPRDAASVRVDLVTVGEWVGGIATPESQCGSDDNRVLSTNPGVGRIVPVGCTGWLVSNAAHLTAGHCMGATMTTLQFNVPPSLCDGTIVNPLPQHQYPITSVVGADGGMGNDWSVFQCGSNSNTGLLPIQAQAAFFRMSRDDDPGTVRVTGFGVDEVPNGCTNGRNSDNQTNQTDGGAYLGQSVVNANNVSIEYTVDTEGGNSGSPVIIGTIQSHTLGIHTNAGCDPPDEGNTGTGFENDSLESAIQMFPGSVVRYVDANHISTAPRDGTVFRPFTSVAAGAASVPTGGVVSIVAGDYTVAAGNVFTAGADGKAMTLQAPVGVVRIGI